MSCEGCGEVQRELERTISHFSTPFCNSSYCKSKPPPPFIEFSPKNRKSFSFSKKKLRVSKKEKKKWVD